MKPVTLVLTALASAFALQLAGPAHGQRRAERSEPRVIQVMPEFQVQVLSGEFEEWGSELVIYKPRTLHFRWGKPVSSERFRWQVYEDAIHPDKLMATGLKAATAGADRLERFRINMSGILPALPPAKETVYLVRVVPDGAGLAASRYARIRYKPDTNNTVFTPQGLYPELFDPMPVYVNLHTFHVHKADEGRDEEPYIIPIVAYLDGTTVNIDDLAGSSVRLDTSKRSNVHGNIPVSNSLGAGDSVSIPGDVGYFEKRIKPVNIEKLETQRILCNPAVDDDGCLIRLKDLTESTVIWIMVVALEEDANDDSTANAVRDVMLDGMRDELNDCVQNMTLADVVNFIVNGLDLEETLTTTDPVSFCGRESTEEDSILDQIRDKLESMGKDAGIADVTQSPWAFLHGGGFNILDDVIDPDDNIGFDWFAVTYDQLMRADGAISFTLDFSKADNRAAGAAVANPVHYEIKGAVGRCRNQPGADRCAPASGPLMPRFPDQ